MSARDWASAPTATIGRKSDKEFNPGLSGYVSSLVKWSYQAFWLSFLAGFCGSLLVRDVRPLLRLHLSHNSLDAKASAVIVAAAASAAWIQLLDRRNSESKDGERTVRGFVHPYIMYVNVCRMYVIYVCISLYVYLMYL